jgi:hypothetical protein
MFGRIKALWLLGTSYFLTLLRARLGLGRQRGLVVFADNYAADALVPVTLKQRQVQLEASGCIACGRCNIGDAPLIEQGRGQYPGLMTLVLAGARGTPDFKAASEGWAYLSATELLAREALCPTRVPLSRLRQYVVERAAGSATHSRL